MVKTYSTEKLNSSLKFKIVFLGNIAFTISVLFLDHENEYRRHRWIGIHAVIHAGLNSHPYIIIKVLLNWRKTSLSVKNIAELSSAHCTCGTAAGWITVYKYPALSTSTATALYDTLELEEYTLGKMRRKFCPFPQKIVLFLKMGIFYRNLLHFSKFE